MKYICFDIGGSFIKYGITDQNGNIFYDDKIPTPKYESGKEIPKVIINIIQKINQEIKAEAIGISTAGQVDIESGKIIFAMDTIPNYTGCELSSIINQSVKLPIFVENDAKCAALGELWKGTGSKYKNFVCLTLGTGVGGAIIINKKLFSGLHGNAGDFGKIKVNSKILPSPSYFDYLGSAKSLITRYTKLTGIEINGYDIINKVKSSDNNAIKAFNDFMESLVEGLQNITYIIDPEAIIIGGGISSQGGVFFEKLLKLFKEKNIGTIDYTKILKAKLENKAGLIGASFICQNRNYQF